MVADWRQDGRVHPAYWWGLGLYLGVFAAFTAFAHTAPAMAVTEWLIAGTPGAERPMEAFLPPDFTL